MNAPAIRVVDATHPLIRAARERFYAHDLIRYRTEALRGKALGTGAGGGFFGASPPGVKLIAKSTTPTVTNGVNSTSFFAFPIPTPISTLPLGRFWRIRSSALCTPGAVACNFNYFVSLMGNSFATNNFPLYGAAWATPTYGASYVDLEAIIANPNPTIGTYLITVTQWHNARAAAPSITDTDVMTTSGSAGYSAGFPLNVYAAVTSNTASLTHQQTSLELLQ